MKVPFVLILLILTCGTTLSQQKAGASNSLEDQLTFYLIDVESGLSHNVVNSIEQDSLGYIWVATIEGLNRYNGKAFLHFKKDLQSPQQSLANNYIQQVKMSMDGSLMIATDGGLNIYHPETEKFSFTDISSGLLSNSISSIAEGPQNDLILGTYRGGVQIISPDGHITSFIHEPENEASLSSEEVSTLAVQGDSVVWAGTYHDGLNKIDYHSKKVTRLLQGRNKVQPEDINALHVDLEGNLWVGTKSGIRVITVKGDSLDLKKGSAPEVGLSDGEVLCFEEDDQGRMWIGTRNGGLNILDKSTFLHQSQAMTINWFLPKSDGTSVYNRTISSIKMDREGNMWLGTSTGVNYVNPSGEAIKLIQRNPSNPPTLSHDRIGAVAAGKDDKIWIGTDGGGLDLLDPRNGHYEHFKHQQDTPNGLSNNYIIALLEDKKGRLWAGTYQGGLNRLDPQTGEFKHYLQGSQEDGHDVRVIYEDHFGNIWVGTNRGGLYHYREEKDQFDYIEKLEKIDIRDIDMDDSGHLWLATFGNGIIQYDPMRALVKTFTMDNTEGMPGEIFFCLVTLDDGDILAGSRYGGLVRVTPGTRAIRTFTENDGLSNNTVSSMVKDPRGLVWLGTFNGISHYDPLHHQIGHLKTSDNIQIGEFNIGAATITKSGHLYFGGNKGLNLFKPEDLVRETDDSPLVLENLNLFNKKVDIASESPKNILSGSIAYQNHITLAHDQSLFSLDFATLKYPFANNVTYSYRLENHHEHWINVRGNGTANLSNIPPGEYVLHIKAHTGSGNEVSRQLAVTITPPFWQTYPAYALYFLIILGLAWAILKYYTERIKLKNSLLLEKKQRQLEHEVNEERLQFFTSFSHELKTPLTLILAPLDDLLSQIQSKKQIQQLTLIHKNASYLHQLISNLLEFRKTETGLGKLTVGEYNISACLEQWSQNYLPLANKKGISLTWSLPERNLMARFDLEKLQIILNNLISNAIKHCQKNDHVWVRLDSDPDYFRITVSDTGPGIDLDEIERIFEWYYQSGSKMKKSGTGIGLALSKSLAELHGGSLRADSVPGRGAQFTLGIPHGLSLSAASAPSTKPELDHTPKADPLPSYMPQSRGPINIKAAKDREVLLLIDDNHDILTYLDGLLEDDYDLIHAEDGKDGMEKALKYVPDLIISDIMMPFQNGIDLCKFLKEHQATTHIPVILLSAKGNPESVQSGFEEGADAYLTKPFNNRILRTRIRNLLDNRKQLRKYFLAQDEPSQEFSKEHSGILKREKQFLSQLDQIIEKQIGKDDVQVDTIAHEIGMSRTSLFRKIKAITGYNINEYIRMARLKKACRLIEKEGLGVSQAAFEVGFSSLKYFRKKFKEQYGKLPSDLMK